MIESSVYEIVSANSYFFCADTPLGSLVHLFVELLLNGIYPALWKPLDDVEIVNNNVYARMIDVNGASIRKDGVGNIRFEAEFDADRFGNDAFAGMYVAVLHDYKEFQAAYPSMWNFVKELLKK